jgi:hypothetical protein
MNGRNPYKGTKQEAAYRRAIRSLRDISADVAAEKAAREAPVVQAALDLAKWNRDAEKDLGK